MCTVSRAKRIIAGVWSFTCVYCMLWFFLVDIHVGRDGTVQCGYKVSRSLYLPVYLIDFAIFYVVPLLVAIVLYGLIAHILYLSPLPNCPEAAGGAANATTLRRSCCREPPEKGSRQGRPKSALSSRKQVCSRTPQIRTLSPFLSCHPLLTPPHPLPSPPPLSPPPSSFLPHHQIDRGD